MSLFPIDLDSSDLPVGAVLVRQYKGTEHRVEVVPQVTVTNAATARGWWRYRYQGRRYKTLSGIAFAITGQRTLSGNEFFGLKRRQRGVKTRRRRAWRW